MMVSFRFRLTEEEYFRFNYYTAWADPRRKKYRILYFLRVIVLYGAVAFLYILATGSKLFWIDVSVFFITGIAYLFLVPYFIKRSVRRKVHDILRRKENQHVLEESEIILSNSGIIDRDTLSESSYDWEAIVHFADIPEAYYLYTNSHHAIVIPKRVLPNETVARETDHLLKSRLPLHA